ncbi:MAG TPA: hypothetical protein VII58_09765 [Acidobacteriaceae bacterium]
MNKSKYVDTSIQALKLMLGDETNELGSDGKRALCDVVGKLKRLSKQQEATYEELYRTVEEVAKTVLKAAHDNGHSKFRS